MPVTAGYWNGAFAMPVTGMSFANALAVRRPSDELLVEPVADAPLTDDTPFRARVVTNDVIVFSDPNENSRKLSRLPLGAGVAVRGGFAYRPTPAAPQGWRRIHTPRGIEGYVGSQYLFYSDRREKPIKTTGKPDRPFVPLAGVHDGTLNSRLAQTFRNQLALARARGDAAKVQEIAQILTSHGADLVSPWPGR